jgi:hypothetical protein
MAFLVVLSILGTLSCPGYTLDKAYRKLGPIEVATMKFSLAFEEVNLRYIVGFSKGLMTTGHRLNRFNGQENFIILIKSYSYAY